MAFINEKDREQLQRELQALVQPVKLVLFVEEKNCEYCDHAKQLLDEIADLSDKITVQVHDLHADKERAVQFQIDKAPAMVVMNGKDYGIRYFGIPSGYEFGSLIDDILDVSKGESGLSAATKEALAKLTQPIHFEVFVTPTCPYCPSAVRTAHQMAVENPMHFTADAIEASEFPHLVSRYDISTVPPVVINDKVQFEGGKAVLLPVSDGLLGEIAPKALAMRRLP